MSNKNQATATAIVTETVIEELGETVTSLSSSEFRNLATRQYETQREGKQELRWNSIVSAFDRLIRSNISKKFFNACKDLLTPEQFQIFESGETAFTKIEDYVKSLGLTVPERIPFNTELNTINANFDTELTKKQKENFVSIASDSKIDIKQYSAHDVYKLCVTLYKESPINKYASLID